MTTAFARRSTRRVAFIATGAVTALALTACAGGGGTGGADATQFGFLVNTENTTITDLLTNLSENACSAENEALPLTVETVPQTQLDQRLQLLAGQNALPAQYAAGNAPALTKELAAGGQVLDFEKTLTDLGVIDQVEPAAVSTIEALYGGFNVLPYQYNIEGIWYNKQILADNGIDGAAGRCRARRRRGHGSTARRVRPVRLAAWSSRAPVRHAASIMHHVGGEGEARIIAEGECGRLGSVGLGRDLIDGVGHPLQEGDDRLGLGFTDLAGCAHHPLVHVAQRHPHRVVGAFRRRDRHTAAVGGVRTAGDVARRLQPVEKSCRRRRGYA